MIPLGSHMYFLCDTVFEQPILLYVYSKHVPIKIYLFSFEIFCVSRSDVNTCVITKSLPLK